MAKRATRGSAFQYAVLGRTQISVQQKSSTKAMMWTQSSALPVSLIVMLTLQTLEDRRRRQQGLPPKKHHNIKDLNLIDVYVHNNDD